MKDLSNFSARLLPQPIHQRGISVIVEPYKATDHAQALWQALGGNTEAVNTHLQYFPQSDFSNFNDFVDWLEKPNVSGDWFTRIFRNAVTGEIVGMASYIRIDEKNGSIEIGCIAHGPAMLRSKMATEVHYLLAKHVFDDLGYRRYEWKCHNNNAKSHAAAKRLGFSFEGIFRQHIISKGKNRDTAWYSIIDSEWAQRRKAFERWLSPQNFDEDDKQKKSLIVIRAEIDTDG